MKNIHVNTAFSFLLSFISLGLILFQIAANPSFDYHLISAFLGLAAWFAAGSEFVKYTSKYQIAGFFLSATAIGLSADNFTGEIPFITLSLLLVNFSQFFRLMFKKYFSEENHHWIDMLTLLLGLGFYVYGNIFQDYKWYSGWLFPAPIYLFFGVLTINDLKFHKAQSGFIRKKMGIDAGNPAPHFSLPDQDGNVVSLSDYTGKRHLLVIFVRGDWCPSCHMKMRTYQKHRDKFQEKNVVLLAIGPDPVGVNRQMASKLGVEYKVLSDEGQKIAMAYSVQLPSSVIGEKYKPGVPLPASFLIDKNGIVRYASSPEKVGEFLNPSAIFPILESLN